MGNHLRKLDGLIDVSQRLPIRERVKMRVDDILRKCINMY